MAATIPDGWPTQALGNASDTPLEYAVTVNGQPWTITVDPGQTEIVPLADEDATAWQAAQQAAVQAAADAGDEPATAADHSAVSAQLVTEKLASVPISRDELPTILQTLLGEASAAIPFFENAVANWASLTADEKDRLSYDACRSLVALMRYLTGDLPTSS